MTDRDVLYKKRGHVALLTINRPEVLNAFRHSTIVSLLCSLEKAALDGSIRVVVITGAGRAFSAGVDLKELADGSPLASQGTTRARLEQTQELTRRMTRLPKVTVAAVNGPAVGLGAELCVAADIRIAADTAMFSFPEVKRALLPTNGITYLLPQVVGLSRAMDWLLSGETISIQEAVTAGLVTHTASTDSLLEDAMQYAKAIAGNAPRSVRLVKQLLHRALTIELDAALEYELVRTLECLKTNDAKEGVRAFFEKRTPSYTDK
jgi:enoyl-CoA hydratase/carnithine racemase